MKQALEVIRDGPGVEEAFPRLFSRSSPMVEEESFTVVAASLLRYHKIEAALVLVKGFQPVETRTKTLFVSGYPILSNLLKKRPAEYYKYLFEPCRRNAIALGSLHNDQKLEDLLHLFRRSRFGFTAVTKGSIHALVGLSDLLALFEQGRLRTDLRVKDVASPTVAMKKHTPLRKAISKMFELRIRRVFIDGTRFFISDREVISLIFSPQRLEECRSSPSALLRGKAEEAGPIAAEKVDGNSTLNDAAQLIMQSQGSALVCEKGVISPWDLVVKPFSMNRLTFTG